MMWYLYGSCKPVVVRKLIGFSAPVAIERTIQGQVKEVRLH
jgi:hypothetical protein